MLPQMQKNYINHLTSNQIEEVQKAFRIFDQDNSGSISIREFDQILKSLGQSLSDEQLQRLVEEIDTDGNGFIDFQEFLFLVAPKIIGKRTQKSYIEAFRLINSSNSGCISLTELMKSNQVTKAGLSENQLTDIINFVTEKYGGKLNVNTMLKMLFRKPQIQ